MSIQASYIVKFTVFTYNKTMRSLKTISVVLICALLILIAAIFFLRRVMKPKYVTNMSSQTVIQQIRSLNRLETAQFTIEKVIDAGTNGGRFQELLFGDRILLIAHGEVIAGFDLAKITEQNVKTENQTLILILPAPEILVSRLDSTLTRVYDRRLGILTKGEKNLESTARMEAEKAIREAACRGNILTEATKNARNQLISLFKATGFKTVQITIPAGNC